MFYILLCDFENVFFIGYLLVCWLVFVVVGVFVGVLLVIGNLKLYFILWGVWLFKLWVVFLDCLESLGYW